MKPLYRIGWILTNLTSQMFFGMKVYNRENIPSDGGFILACNHISLADPPLVGSALKRPIHYMAKKELFHNRLFGKILYRVNTHPIKRTGFDRAALEEAGHILKLGEGMIIFPEGTRARNGNFLPARPGIGMIARTCEVPVIPVFIDGSDRLSDCFFGRKRLRVIFGKVLDKDYIASYDNDKVSYRKLADEIMERIKDLKIELYQKSGK